MSQKAYLAIDFAYEHGQLVLFSENGVEFLVDMPVKLDHAKEIGSAIERALLHCEQHKLLLSGMFCGIGPGSFVGIRIALATALGFSLPNELPLMGFCSHRALLREKCDCYIFMKASGDLGYLTGYVVEDGRMVVGSPTKVVAIHELDGLIDEGAVMLSDQAFKLESFRAQSILGPTASGIYEACLERLSQGLVDESNYIKPNYVKPPTVSRPC